MKRHKTFYADTIKEVEYCGTKIYQVSGNDYEVPFPVKKSKTKHSLENCNNCAKHHKLLIDEFKEDLVKFPNCCNNHKRLVEISEFNIDDFFEVDRWCADKIMFSYHHFLEWIDEENWYSEITDYLEYCIESYGSFPSNCGEPFRFSDYFNCLIHLLNSKFVQNEIECENVSRNELKKRTIKIISYLNSYADPDRNNDRDINLLFSKYNEWYKLFPFELEFFKPLRDKFKMTIPIFNGRKKYNKYLGVYKRETHTKESLSALLINTTKIIISSINTLSLYEKGSLNNVEKINLDLLIERRKLELKELAIIPNEDTRVYIKTLKKWLKSEKKFVKEITPLLEKSKPQSNSSRPNRTDIAYFAYYTSQSKSLKTKNIFPSGKAWEEIGGLFDKNSKNIETVYNTILDKDERLKKTKKKNITYVIENMLKEHPKALNLAIDELKLVELNS